MKRKSIVAALLAVSLAACVTVNKSVLNRSHAAQPVLKEDVQVYFASDTLPPHERIALLDAKGDDATVSETKMIDKLREEAGKLGANAIVLNEVKGATAVAKVANVVFGTPAERKAAALAIFVPSLVKTK